LAKKGEKLSEKTKDLISKNNTKRKTLCRYCKKMIANLDSHYGNCRKNPANKERFHIETNQYREKNKEKINQQQNIATAKRMQIPEKREHRQKKQHDNRQKPEVKKRNNENRNISRPKRDKKTKQKLIDIIGGDICKNCDFKDHRAFVKEHIHNDGHLDNKKFKSDKRKRDLYYSKNPEEVKNKLQLYCSNCNAVKKFDHESKKEKKMGPRNIRDRDNYRKDKDSAFETLGGYICIKCKFKDSRALDIEHIHGGGNKHRDEFSRQDGFYRDIRDNPEKSKKILQIMCRNCNTIKQHIFDNGNCKCELFHVEYFKNFEPNLK
jgi:hypothetical protein